MMDRLAQPISHSQSVIALSALQDAVLAVLCVSAMMWYRRYVPSSPIPFSFIRRVFSYVGASDFESLKKSILGTLVL